MTDVRARLLAKAQQRCLPYLLDLPRFAPYVNDLTFILVGSVAADLCHEDSDIDIAILCESDVYDSIAADTAWRRGRPSEIEIDGTQLHYYAETFERVESALKSLDDVSLYAYSSAVPLHDPKNQHARRFAWFSQDAHGIRKERLEGKLDMFLRRSRALEQSLNDPDIILLARMALELITRAAKIAALLDRIPFDPRRRLFRIAVSGITGRLIEPSLREMLAAVGDLASSEARMSSAVNRLRRTTAQAVECLSAEARMQDLRVGLEAPDYRQSNE